MIIQFFLNIHISIEVALDETQHFNCYISDAKIEQLHDCSWSGMRL